LTLRGNELANAISGANGSDTLVGNGGNDTLDGGLGADTMVGGLGNDLYWVDNTGDVVDETGGSGKDVIRSTVSFSLAASPKLADVEILYLTGNNDDLDAVGNALDNLIKGNTGNNVINGDAGNDRLEGRGGADWFEFTTPLSINNVDTIMDFTVGEDRFRIDDAVFSGGGLALGTLAESRFVIAAAALDSNDRVVYNSTTGAVYYDADGTGAGAQVQFATVGTGLAMTNTSFVVV